MPLLLESALEHLQPGERDCVARYIELLCEQLGSRLLEVHLFGSFARGDAWGPRSPMHSDVDLLVLCSEQPGQEAIDELINETYPLFLECGRQIAPQFRTREAVEAPTTERGKEFLERLRQEGRVVYVADAKPGRD
jgi:predicted nucleotidyltransferase